MTQQQLQYAYFQKMRQQSIYNMLSRRVGSIKKSKPVPPPTINPYSITFNKDCPYEQAWTYTINGETKTGTWGIVYDIGYNGTNFSLNITIPTGYTISSITCDGEIWKYWNKFTVTETECSGSFVVSESDENTNDSIVVVFEEIT